MWDITEQLRFMNPKIHGSDWRLHISVLETWFLMGPGIAISSFCID